MCCASGRVALSRSASARATRLGQGKMGDLGNRHAKYYELTSRGRKQLAAEESAWRKLSIAVGQVLASV